MASFWRSDIQRTDTEGREGRQSYTREGWTNTVTLTQARKHRHILNWNIKHRISHLDITHTDLWGELASHTNQKAHNSHVHYTGPTKPVKGPQ